MFWLGCWRKASRGILQIKLLPFQRVTAIKTLNNKPPPREHVQASWSHSGVLADMLLPYLYSPSRYEWNTRYWRWQPYYNRGRFWMPDTEQQLLHFLFHFKRKCWLGTCGTAVYQIVFLWYALGLPQCDTRWVYLNVIRAGFTSISNCDMRWV